jgi:hypothetical protein
VKEPDIDGLHGVLEGVSCRHLAMFSQDHGIIELTEVTVA